MAEASLESSASTKTAPEAGKGLSRQYSFYPRTPSIKSLRGFLSIAFQTMRMLYSNEFTRGIGRDVIFFGGSVVLIRLLVIAFDESPPVQP